MSAERYRASLQLNNFICSSRAITETKSPASQSRRYGHIRFRASRRAYLEALSGSCQRGKGGKCVLKVAESLCCGWISKEVGTEGIRAVWEKKVYEMNKCLTLVHLTRNGLR